MKARPFHFKRFTVLQESATHKVGTDGVLLGAWLKVVKEDLSILDIGTGSGLIALMLAQRTSPEAHIDAVEISEADARQAAENVMRSPWPSKIAVHHTAIQAFFPRAQYDLIVSNPPFFFNSLKPPHQARGVARHTKDLSFEDLLACVTRLLAPHGRFALILPPAEALHLTEQAKAHGLQPMRKCSFRARHMKPVERELLELSRDRVKLTKEDLVLYGAGDAWTEAYKILTADFYLKC